MNTDESLKNKIETIELYILSRYSLEMYCGKSIYLFTLNESQKAQLMLLHSQGLNQCKISKKVKC